MVKPMERFDYLVIGGGVAGTTAAETIRGRNPSAAIAVVSDEPYPLYSRVLLPNYVKGAVSRERVFLRKGEDYAAKGIALLSGEVAERLEAGERTLHLASGRAIAFGKLLVATGGRPSRLGIPGEELPGVSRFHTIDDADRMLKLLAEARRAVVVGGGFIALEYLEILVNRGIPVTLVIPQPYFFSRFFDAAGGRLLHENFRRHSIEVITDDRLAVAEGEGRLAGVRLASGKALAADFLGIGVGLRRNMAWLGRNVLLTANSVSADEYLETSEPGIFAAGDITDFNDLVLGFRHTHGNWGNAFRQGERAGRNMAGADERQPYLGVTSYGIRNLGFSLALVGHASAGRGIETVARYDPGAPSYGRFFLRGERLVGAALINRPEDRSAITILIRDAVPLTAAGGVALADPSVDIAALVP